MKYGAKMLQWAPFSAENAEPPNSLPSYGAPVNLGALSKVTETVTMNSVKGYGDNATKVHVIEFKEAGLAVEVTELSNANASAIYGATLDTAPEKDLHFNGEDAVPYGGLAFYINKMLDDNSKVYQGIYYPKAKAELQGDDYSTKGESIVLTNTKIQFAAEKCNSGDWKLFSENFTTEAEAAAWVNEKIKAAG